MALATASRRASYSQSSVTKKLRNPGPAIVATLFKPAGFQSSRKYAAIVVDAKTGEVLYAKRADAPRYPASITKVMTLYLLFEALETGEISMRDRITFSARAAGQSGLTAGKARLRATVLLRGIMRFLE